jgi:anti-sigma factor RsiW
MNPFDERHQQALEALAREAAADAGPHADLGRLEAYAEGRLEGAEADEVRAHVALCPECGELVLALREVDEVEPSSVLTPAEKAEDWARLREALDDGAPGDLPQPPAKASTVLPAADSSVQISTGRDWPWSRLAASLMVGFLLGLLFGRGPAPGPSAENPKSQPNPQIVELSPEGSGVTRGPEEPEPATNGPLIFILDTLKAQPEEVYEVVIRCPGGQPLRQGNLLRTPAGSVRLQVERGVLASGECRLELFRSTAQAFEPLETYRYRVPADAVP